MFQETFLEDGKGPVKEQEESVLPFDTLKKYLSEVSRYQVLSREGGAGSGREGAPL